jgi:hypothetical protein
MKLEDHCLQAKQMFGSEYKDVHIWLDEYANKFRHHSKGIKEAREMFGNTAGDVAFHHVIADLKEEGWTEKDRIPKDEKDYTNMDLNKGNKCRQ